MKTENELKLLEAAKLRKTEKVRELLAIGTNPHAIPPGFPSHWKEMPDYESPIGEVLQNIYSSEHIDIVTMLLNAGVDVDATTHHTVSGISYTPLELALRAQKDMTRLDKQIQVVELLLSKGADINKLSDATLIHVLKERDTKLFKIILDAGLDPNKKIANKSLLENAAHVSSSDNDEFTNAKLLIKYGANISTDILRKIYEPNLLVAAIAKGATLDVFTLFDPVILQSGDFTLQLIRRGDDMNDTNVAGLTPLMLACERGYQEGATALIHAGAKLNIHTKDGDTALHLALAHAQNFSNMGCRYSADKRYAITLDLYSFGAIPYLDKHGRTPLMRLHLGGRPFSAINFCIREFSKFEAAHYSYDEQEYAAAVYQVYSGMLERSIKDARPGLPASFYQPMIEKPIHPFQSALKRKIHQNVQTAEEMKIQIKKELLIAIINKNKTKIEIILNAHPDIDINTITDAHGRRPLSIIIHDVIFMQHECRPILDLLRSRGADVNLKNSDEKRTTPLHVTCDGHRINKQVMKYLLKNGANPNIPDASHKTLLHSTLAFCVADSEAFDILMQYGADPDQDIANNSDLTEDSLDAFKSVFKKYTPDNNNPIDVALQAITLQSNRTLLIYALKTEHLFAVYPSDMTVKASLGLLLNSLITSGDLSPYAQNRLAFLSLLEKDTALEILPFTLDDYNQFTNLVKSLYEANVNINNAFSQAKSKFNDTMGQPLHLLSLWNRARSNPNPVIASQAQQHLDRMII